MASGAGSSVTEYQGAERFTGERETRAKREDEEIQPRASHFCRMEKLTGDVVKMQERWKIPKKVRLEGIEWVCSRFLLIFYGEVSLN